MVIDTIQKIVAVIRLDADRMEEIAWGGRQGIPASDAYAHELLHRAAEARKWADRLAALSARASAGEGGEPVAWRYRYWDTFGWRLTLYKPAFSVGDEGTVEPLYTAAPQPAQAGASGGGDVLTDDERAAIEFYRLNPRAATFDLKRRLTTPQPAAAQGGIADLPAKWREDASGAEGYNYTTYEEGRIAEKRRCAAELEAALAAAPQPQKMELPTYTELAEAGVIGGCNGRHPAEYRCYEGCKVTPPAHGDGEAYPTSSDREVLLYLMQQFDAESWQCPCGRSESCADMDSALYLRNYLATRPTPEAQEARDAARLRYVCEHNWIGAKTRCERGIMDSDIASLRAAIDAALALPAQGREGDRG